MSKNCRVFYEVRRVTQTLLWLLCFSILLFSGSKKTKTEPDPEGPATFKVQVNVVVVSASVTDKSGNPVTDLTADDFKIYDEDELQTIHTFSQESYSPPEEESISQTEASKPKVMGKKETRPRMISLLFDDLTMTEPSVFPRMIEQAKKFIKMDMGSMDQVALLSGSGKVNFPYSNDKQQILDKLADAVNRLNYMTPNRSNNITTDLDAYIISQPGIGISVYKKLVKNVALAPGSESAAEEFLYIDACAHARSVAYRTSQFLNTVRQHIRALKHFEGHRIVVLFTEGFLAEPNSPAASQLQEIIDMALRSGIVLNCISPLGVRYMEPSGDTEISPAKDLLARESPLNQMTKDTGGTFFFNNNDLQKGLKEIAQQKYHRYFLSYALSQQKANGLYRHIKLELTRPDLKLSYRKGYYTPKEELTLQNKNKEDILEALFGYSPGNMNEIPMTLGYNYSQEDDSAYAVSFLTSVNIRDLRFLEEESRHKNVVNLVLAAFDENDKFIDGLQKTIDLNLLGNSYVNLRDRGLSSRVELKLPPGRFKIKAVFREELSGKMGSITKSVEIP
jgi:VWFA-related protein